MSLKPVFIVAAAAIVLCAGVAQADPVELAVNGGFETGTFDGWTVYPSSPGNINIATPGSVGAFAAYLNNAVAPSAALIKNANLGVGLVVPAEVITISFDARGMLGIGGVAFAEFFSEISGGGVSKSQILGNAPLALDSNPDTWKHFTFTTTAGPIVSGGVTLQLSATTGAILGSTAQIYYDNVSVTVDRAAVPAVSTTWSAVKQLF
jgi:hypothetical protein